MKLLEAPHTIQMVSESSIFDFKLNNNTIMKLSNSMYQAKEVFENETVNMFLNSINQYFGQRLFDNMNTSGNLYKQWFLGFGHTIQALIDSQLLYFDKNSIDNTFIGGYEIAALKSFSIDFFDYSDGFENTRIEGFSGDVSEKATVAIAIIDSIIEKLQSHYNKVSQSYYLLKRQLNE